jgi:hypothetical protein
MAVGLRSWVYLLLGVLWASGVVWLCLDQFFSTRGPFGKTPHPWEQPIVLLHGIVAVAAMYLLGWISAQHVSHWWARRLRRVSGTLLCAFLGVLVVSGFALFFVSDDRWQRIAAVLHEISGLGITPIAAQHWFLRQKEKRVWRSKQGVIAGRSGPGQ